MRVQLLIEFMRLVSQWANGQIWRRRRREMAKSHVGRMEAWGETTNEVCFQREALPRGGVGLRMMVGIELGRAVPYVEVYQTRPFGCEVGSIGTARRERW